MVTYVWQGRPTPAGRRHFAAAALLLLMAACTDTGLEPSVRAAAPEAPSASLTSRLMPTGVKYRDSSAPHATGRSGSATLAARAVLGADGKTYLTVTTGDLDDLDAAPGELAKVQVKAFTPDGEALFTLNFQRPSRGGSVTLVLDGLMAGAQLRVQANVRGIDWTRTDVVTLTETVKRAPALDVDVNAPAQVVAGAPTVITGVVSETNGQAGTWATCELWINGREVVQEEIQRVWIDAGDAVTCAFTYAFPGPGSYDVEVRVRPDQGGTVTGMATSLVNVDVVSPNVATWTAEAEEKTVLTSRVYEYHWENPTTGGRKEYRDEITDGVRTQTLTVAGALPRAAVFPLATVELRMESAGIVHHDESWTALVGVPNLSGQTCLSQTVTQQGAMFHFCSGPGSTTFGYTRFAGTVTYHSQGFSRVWDGAGAQIQNWTWNDFYETHHTGGQIKLWGDDVTVRIRVTDGAGSFGVAPVIPLSSFDNVLSTTPRVCDLEYHYWLDGNAQENCRYGQVREFGRRGSTTG